ncbi:energy-coupling factor ABC transporter permease [Neisseria weaveri]|uniref:Integral membrane protein n=1 Tax=Neisseria weaveri TaxID=28091 RepID=A0A448VQP7_9NEIS|nr:energy-coupling factor ABC transporter permease [Neisseria weaveri]SAY50729.1 integral membrane protein [Neisseria weaveri]VEJ52128.1 integral membrane protein [Neisseria weaveri]
MNFLSEWFSQEWQYAAHALWAAVLLLCAKPAWKAIKSHPRSAGLVLLILSVLWSMGTELDNGQLSGMAYHLLGINLAAMIIGTPAALWLSALLWLPYTLLHHPESLNVSSLNALCLFLLPALLNAVFRHLTAKLPANLFIYIFANGFIAAAAGFISAGALLVFALQLSGAYPTSVLWESAFPVFFLLAWGEAFLSGIFTAIFVALKPQLLITFDDNRYLHKTNHIWK